MLNEIDLCHADLNLLVLFEAVLEERHVGRAADRMRLTPSAVSHGLGRLRRLLNDPLFLRTPKGVVPTARAMELAAPIAEVLVRVRNVVSTAAPFDPSRSTRRFMVGAPDAVSAVFLSSLLANLRRVAPGIDISVRQLLPPHGSRTSGGAWEPAFAELEARTIDIAIAPVGDVPVRFVDHTLYEEDFVIAARAGHPYAKSPNLERFCRMQHLVVSLTGDAYGFVDELLAKRGLSRRVALTVPNFMMAFAMLEETDLIAALPRHLVAMHAPRFKLTSMEAPLPLRRDPIRVIASKAAMMDAGVAWLFGVLQHAHPTTPAKKRRSANL
jgi:DNA-binding transcriptional LysR family regulator